MCGLVGLAGDVMAKEKDVFSELLLVDVVRGAHSTGAALVRRVNGEVLMEKAPCPSPIFVNLDIYKKLIENVGLKVLLGHNRYATVGEKSASNAHPFDFPNVIGAHNGTLDSWALKHHLENYKNFGTDSEAIYDSISRIGLKPTIEGLTGAWALTWYNKQDGTMNLLRNDKRPLFYCYNDTRTTLFWASEGDMLEWILRREHIKLFENTIYELPSDQHYSWVVPTMAGTKFEAPTMEKIEGYSFTYQGSGAYGGPWESFSNSNRAYRESNNANSGSSNVVNHTHLGKPGGKKVVPIDLNSKIDTKKFRPPYKDAYGRVINKPQLHSLILNGCVYCEDTSSEWLDFIFPLKDDMDGRKLYMCEDCYNDDEIRPLIKYAL